MGLSSTATAECAFCKLAGAPWLPQNNAMEEHLANPTCFVRISIFDAPSMIDLLRFRPYRNLRATCGHLRVACSQMTVCVSQILSLASVRQICARGM